MEAALQLCIRVEKQRVWSHDGARVEFCKEAGGTGA